MYTLIYSTFRRSKPGLSEELIRWMGAFWPVTYHMKCRKIRVISVLSETQRIFALKIGINFQYHSLKYIAPPSMNHWYLFIKSKIASLYPLTIQRLSTKLFIYLISIMVGVQSLSTLPMGQALPRDSCILNIVTGKLEHLDFSEHKRQKSHDFRLIDYIYVHTTILLFHCLLPPIS